MKKLLASAILALFFSGFTSGAQAAECGTVSIAEMKWPSAGIAAHVDRMVLEAGYGCSVTLVSGDTIPTFASMNEKGTPDLAPELWANAVRGQLDRAISEGRLLQMAPILSDGGIEGWWIPKFIADEHRNIRTVEDALKHPELFPAPGNPEKGAVHTCPPDWSCRAATDNLFHALNGTAAGFDLISPATPAEFDNSIVHAFEAKTGWLGYYWAPTALLGKYEMVKLSFGVGHDRTEWERCTAIPDCPDPKVNSYPISDVFTVVTKRFSQKAAVTMDYMKVRKWDNATIGKVMAWMDENGATTEEAARHFFETYPDLWRTWVTPDVAARIKAALDEGGKKQGTE